MKTWSFFSLTSGLFCQATRSCSDPENDFAKPTPGFGRVQGLFDHRKFKVELDGLERSDTPTIVNYVPPSPGEDYLYNLASKEWELSDEAKKAIRDDQLARRELRLIDHGDKMTRYLAEIAEGTIDDIGRQEFKRLMDRKRELKAKLKRATP